MIEQISGAGLSGTTGKSTKQGKGGLFSKLLTLLEKHAETSGKGKGLQLNVAKSEKAKGLVGLTGLAEKADPMLAAKNKLLLAMAEKEKSQGKGESDEAATSLLVAHVIVDQVILSKKSDEIGKTSVLIAGQAAGKNSGKTGIQGGEKGAGQGAKNSALNKGAEKLGQGAAVLNQKAQGMVSGEGGDVLAPQFKGELGKQTQALDLESTRLTSSKITVGASVVTQKNQGAEQSVKGTSLTGLGQLEADSQVVLNKTEGKASIPAGLEEKKAEVMAQSFQGLGEKPAAKTSTEVMAQSSHGLGEKPAAKTSAEVMGAAVGAHFQQAKAAQIQQFNSAAVAAGVQVHVPESSLGDSGTQFSDNKGGQGAQSSTAMLGDVKSAGSFSSASANFQSYLTSKNVPVLSVFDSMNHIAQSAKNGQTRLEIQLDPANLGKIQISLQSDASKQLQVHMVVDQSMTRTALEQQLPQLRSALAQQGFDLSGFSMGSHEQQASSDGGSNGPRSGSLNHDDAEVTMLDSSVEQSQQINSASGLSIRV